MDEKAAAAVGLGFCGRFEAQNIRPVLVGVDGRTDDGPVAARDGADVGNALEGRIVFSFARAGIGGGNVLAVLLEFSTALGVGPG